MENLTEEQKVEFNQKLVDLCNEYDVRLGVNIKNITYDYDITVVPQNVENPQKLEDGETNSTGSPDGAVQRPSAPDGSE
jgi:hypothetical protein